MVDIMTDAILAMTQGPFEAAPRRTSDDASGIRGRPRAGGVFRDGSRSNMALVPVVLLLTLRLAPECHTAYNTGPLYIGGA